MSIRHKIPLDCPGEFAYKLCGTLLHKAQFEIASVDAKDKTIVAGRRFGKTMVQAIETIIFALKHPGSEQYIVAPTQDQAAIIFSMIESMVMNGPLEASVEKMRFSPFPQMVWKNGSRIHARSGGVDGKYLRGHHADRIVFDEAAFIPEVIITEVVPPMLSASKLGYQVRISTPFGKNHFWESYANARRQMKDVPDQFWCGKYPTWLNPHVSRDYLRRERSQRTALAWAVEYAAEFHEDQNVMFPWRDIESGMDGDLPHPLNPVPGHRYVIGYDPAKWHDRSGLCVLDATFDHSVVAAIQDLSGRDYTVQEEMVATYAERYNHAVVLMDSTSHDRTLEALQDRCEAYGYKFTNESKWELMSHAALQMEKRNVTFPQHQEFIKELQFYEMVLGKSGLPKLGAPEKHYDDYVTAFALALLQAKVKPAEVTVDWAGF